MRIRNKHTFKEFVNNNLLLLLIIGCGITFISIICYVEERGLMGIEIFSIILYNSLYTMKNLRIGVDIY